MSNQFETTIMIRVVHDADDSDGRNAWIQAGLLRKVTHAALKGKLEDAMEGINDARVVAIDVTMPRKIED